MILRISTLQQWEIRLGFYTIRSSLVAQLGKNLSAMQETPVQFWGWEILWRRNRLPTPVFLGFPCGSAGKESACNVGDLGSIPGLGRSAEEGNGYPLQYSGLENSVDCIVHGVAKSQTRLSDFYFTSLLYHHLWKWSRVPGPGILAHFWWTSFHLLPIFITSLKVCGILHHAFYLLVLISTRI